MTDAADQPHEQGETREDPPALPDPSSLRKDGMPVGRPFTPGDPRINRTGAKGLRKLLEEALEQETEIEPIKGQGKQTRTNAEWIIKVAITRAMKGDFRYFKEILHQLEGAPTKRIVVSEAPPSLEHLTDEEFAKLADAWSEIRKTLAAPDESE